MYFSNKLYQSIYLQNIRIFTKPRLHKNAANLKKFNDKTTCDHMTYLRYHSFKMQTHASSSADNFHKKRSYSSHERLFNAFNL